MIGDYNIALPPVMRFIVQEHLLRDFYLFPHRVVIDAKIGPDHLEFFCDKTAVWRYSKN